MGDTKGQGPLYFFHVPKTGGTTLQHLLEQHFDPATVCPAQDEPGFSQLADEQLDYYQYFAGHFWSLPQRLKGPVRMFTWLRDPVQRAVSMHKHILRDNNHPLHRLAQEDGGFTAMLEHPALRNSSARHLARVHENYQQTLDDKGCLPLAQQVIDRCMFVGFTETYQTSVEALYDLLDWGSQNEIPQLNSASEHSPGVQVSDAMHEQLSAANQIDYEIYHYARNRY